jgi:hypothetical protein
MKKKRNYDFGNKTFPMNVWLNSVNPWNAQSIMVHGIKLTIEKQKIYTMQDYIRLQSVVPYLMTECILTEEHSEPLSPLVVETPYVAPVQEEVIKTPRVKIKEDLPKDIAYSIDIPDMKIVEEEKEEIKKEEKKVSKKRIDVKESPNNE